MTVKVGSLGRSGIGAVILFGGALATVALASAFVLRENGRNSGEDRRSIDRRNTPPAAVNKRNKKKEQHGAKTGLLCILLDSCSHAQKHLSVAREVVESDGDTTALLVSTHSLTPDKEAGMEINSKREANGEILCSISSKKLENDAISDGRIVNKEALLPLGEKSLFEPTNMMHGVNFQPSTTLKIEEKEGCISHDGEEAMEKTMDTAAGWLESSEEGKRADSSSSGAIASRSHSEDAKEALLPVLHSPTIQHENATGDEREVALTEAMETIQENQVKYIDEQLVRKQEQLYEPDDEIVLEEARQGLLRSEGNNEENIPCGKEGNVCLVNPTREKSLLVKEELVNLIEVDRDAANEGFFQQNGHEDDVEKNTGVEFDEPAETIDIETGTATDDPVNETDGDDINQVKNSSIRTQDSAMEPQEVEGNIQEDKGVKIERQRHDFEDSPKTALHSSECNSWNTTEIFPIVARATQFRDRKGISANSFTEMYAEDQATLKYYSMRSKWWRMLTWTVFAMSSLSFSQFFHLSFVMLCFFVFFTLVLSRIYGH